MREQREVMQGMKPLFDEAEARGLWFWTPYQGLWFSPTQLRDAQAQGRFRWGPVNWQLRDPQERVAAAEAQVAAAERELARIKAEIAAAESLS